MTALRVETIIAASPHAVFTCWTYANMMSHWLCNRAILNARVGHTYSLIWDDGHWAAGTFTHVELNTRVSFSWTEANSPGKTSIELTLTPEGADTRLELIQSGFGDGKEWEDYRSSLATGWADMLDNLKTLLETANDPRYLRRPTIGVNFEPLSDDRRAALGITEPYGIGLTIVPVEGPAGKAGLLAGDVLLVLNGVEMRDFPDISRSIAGKKAGDTTSVSIWRDGEIKTMELVLGARTPSDYPETRAELEEVVAERVAEAERELDELFAGVSEHVLSAKPAPAEWSANEVLAHLIWTERWTQQSLWLMHTAGIDPVWGFNNEFEIAGIIAVQPQSAALLAELKRALNEQRQMVRKISDDVVSVKPLFALMSGWLSFIGDHLREHYDQIRAAIAHAQETQPAYVSQKDYADVRSQD